MRRFSDNPNFLREFAYWLNELKTSLNELQLSLNESYDLIGQTPIKKTSENRSLTKIHKNPRPNRPRILNRTQKSSPRARRLLMELMRGFEPLTC